MSIRERMLKDGEGLVAEVEVESRGQFGTSQIGSILVTDHRILFLQLSNGSWKKFDSHQLSSDPFAQHTDRELRTVFVPEPDNEPVAELQSKYIKTVESTTGTSYFTEILEEAGNEPTKNPSECTCERLSSNEVLVEDQNLELEERFGKNEFRFVSCKKCYQIYGRYREGKKHSLTKLFSADWLLDGNTSFDSIVELGQDDAFAIHHAPGDSIRVQDAIVTLSHIASRSNDIVSTYKHDYQHALCYILADEIVAYLTWEEHERGPILSQLYVREEHRQKGIAEEMVSGWYERVCDADHYYADELTDGGRAVLSSAGHLGSKEVPAREVLSLDPMAFG